MLRRFIHPRALRGLRQAAYWLAVLLAALLAFSPEQAAAQTKTDIVPDTWQGDVLRPKPDMRGLAKLQIRHRQRLPALPLLR